MMALYVFPNYVLVLAQNVAGNIFEVLADEWFLFGHKFTSTD